MSLMNFSYLSPQNSKAYRDIISLKLGDCNLVEIRKSDTAKLLENKRAYSVPVDDYNVYFSGDHVGYITFNGNRIIAAWSSSLTPGNVLYCRRIPKEQVVTDNCTRYEKLPISFFNDTIRQFHLSYIRKLFMYKILNQSK